MEVALAGDIDELAGRFDAARARGASEAAAEIKAAILACVTPETRQIAYAGDIAMYVRACMGAMTAAHDRWMLSAENKRMERIALVDALVTVKLMAEGKVPVPAEAFTGEPEEADALNAVAALVKGHDRLIHAIMGSVDIGADRLRAICEAEALRKARDERDRLTAVLAAERCAMALEGWRWTSTSNASRGEGGRPGYASINRGSCAVGSHPWRWYACGREGQAATALEAMEAADNAAKEAT